MSAPQARNFFGICNHFKGGNRGMSAPQARIFFGYMTILKGEIGVRARRRRENFGYPRFFKSQKSIPTKKSIPSDFSQKSITPTLKGPD